MIVPAQFIVTYLPAAQKVMGTAAVPLYDGLLMVAIGVSFFVTIDIEKQLRLTLRRPLNG